MEAIKGIYRSAHDYFTGECEMPKVDVDVGSLLAFREKPMVDPAFRSTNRSFSAFDISTSVMGIMLVLAASRLEQVGKLSSRFQAREHLHALKKQLTQTGNLTQLTQGLGTVLGFGATAMGTRIADGIVGRQPWKLVSLIDRHIYSVRPTDALGRERQHKAITSAASSLPQIASMSGGMWQAQGAPEQATRQALHQQQQGDEQSKASKGEQLGAARREFTENASRQIQLMGQLGAEMARAGGGG